MSEGYSLFLTDFDGGKVLESLTGCLSYFETNFYEYYKESPMMRDAIYSLRGRNEAVHRYDLEQQVIHKIQCA